MKNPIYLPVWHDVLVELYKAPDYRRYCQKINHEVQASSNHLRTIVRLLEKEKLITVIPTKKIKRIVLTEKGNRVAVAIINIMSELGWH